MCTLQRTLDDGDDGDDLYYHRRALLLQDLNGTGKSNPAQQQKPEREKEKTKKGGAEALLVI